MRRVGPPAEWLPTHQQVPWRQFLGLFPHDWAMKMLRHSLMLTHNNPKGR